MLIEKTPRILHLAEGGIDVLAILLRAAKLLFSYNIIIKRI